MLNRLVQLQANKMSDWVRNFNMFCENIFEGVMYKYSLFRKWSQLPVCPWLPVQLSPTWLILAKICSFSSDNSIFKISNPIMCPNMNFRNVDLFALFKEKTLYNISIMYFMLSKYPEECLKCYRYSVCSCFLWYILCQVGRRPYIFVNGRRSKFYFNEIHIIL